MIFLKKIFIYIGLWWTFSCLIFQWGCVRIAPYPTPETKGFIGNLHVDGVNAFLNQKRAYHRMKIYSGDNVTVGAATRVRVMFPDGGFIELDENTDPDFRKWFEAGKCIIKIFFKFGRTYGETGHECDIIVNTDYLDAVSKTKFNMEITPQQTILTVIEGRMMLERPERRPIEQSYQVVVSDQGVKSVRPLSSEELRSVTGWRLGWCCSQGRVFESSPEDCRQRRGSFYYDENEVRERCQKRPGWCCSQGQVFESSPKDCQRRRDFFSYDEREVRQRCEQPSVIGYCCRKGEVFQSERSQCLRQG
ncbi:MAG: hypothetical protein U9N60_09620, partial [Thermodesulfobacteriota bacterium]|nr:hypothetical protein [Thermodesulfobacteriota bacterium]